MGEIGNLVNKDFYFLRNVREKCRTDGSKSNENFLLNKNIQSAVS